MLCAIAYGLGQCLVTAALATYTVLHITNACKAARDIRNVMFWENNLREIKAIREFEGVPKC